MRKYVVLSTDRLVQAFCEPVGMDPKHVRRIVVDMEVGSLPRVYFETFGDDATVDVLLEGGAIDIIEREEEAA